MNEKTSNCKIGDEFNIKEFVETNTISANRTRWITIALVVASVVIFIGFYNSMKISWASFRIDSLKDFENVPENNIGEINGQKPLLDVLFGKHDFKNFKGFACKFNDSKFENDKISQYILESLNDRTLKSLAEECNPENLGKAPSEPFIETVKGDLNRILRQKFLYNSDRFPPKNRDNETERYIVIATEKTDSILNLKENDLIRMNRLLLEEAYQGEIFKSKILIPSDEKLISKEIPSRIAFDDKVLFLEIPFFGIPIDVNDLGFIGGISLFIILSLLRFSQSREIKNLNLSFKEAFRHNKLCNFYHLLAMHQVFTVPHMEGEIRNKILSMLAKWVYFLPVIVICFGVGYDYYSVLSLHLFEWEFVKNQLYFQIPSIILVLYMSLRCLERQFHIDKIWNYFYYIRREKTTTLKRKYNKEIKKSEDYDEKFVEIYENYFSDEILDEPFWAIALYRIGIYNLKQFYSWLFKPLYNFFKG